MNRLTVLGALQPRYDLTWCADKLRRISVGLIRDFMCWMKFQSIEASNFKLHIQIDHRKEKCTMREP